MGPAVCQGPGAISMKLEWVQGAPPHLHTQTSYAGTRDDTRWRAYMPATIIVARGLLSPMPVNGRRISDMGERVKFYFNFPTNFAKSWPLSIFLNILHT